MENNDKVYKAFDKNGGILKTSELNKLGLYSRQINRLLRNNVIIRVKRGIYELANSTYPEEAVITRLFPQSVFFLESALMYYGYTDRMPRAWQIAVDRDSEKNQYKINYPLIDVFYMKKDILNLGVDVIQIEGVDIKLFNRDRTVCDILRHRNKLEKEVFTNAIQRYLKDPQKDIRKLIEYSSLLKIKNLMQTYVGIWL